MSHYDTAEPAADDDFGLVDFDFADSDTPAAAHAEHNESPALPGDEFDYANMDDADFEMLVDNPPTETATAIHSDTEGAGQHTEELVDFTEESLIEPDSIAEDAGSSSLPDDEKLHDSLTVNPAESAEVSVLAPAPSGHADEDTNGADLPAGTPAELIRSPALRTAGTDDSLAATDNYDSLVTDPFESATSPALPPADFVHDVEGTHAVDHSVYDHQTEDDALVNYEDSDVEAEIEEIRTTDPTRRVPDAQVPVTWVFCEGDWMVYLGPEQTSYDAEYQHVLFHMSIAQLINNLHTDTLLKDEVEIALEFPSLGLKIDMRDQESFEITLAQLYKESQLPSGLASSPYFTSASASNYCPSPESFAFVIHTRNSVQSTLEHIMHTLSQHEASIEAVIPPSEDPVTVEGSVEPESVDEAEPAALSEEAVEHVPRESDLEDHSADESLEAAA
ncbi:hypothetical protein DL89DRAFT_270720 [Linderina pennispora]|uniref:Uncharacterized protein n=1 Tax=Linderina pennispora TaxID=61395 RepID=A0A1Y1VXB0_9FUNG|nr:uncharacterized protein DL89DRAFT_270720 [Linderina pennispora]ORX65655.1 hypothetical protein DL89DRAFT_270720 [Linderina pennispora]